MIESFGKYEVLGLLGEGGFGKVYRALDPDLKREVAVKTCSFDEERLRRRFVQEAEVAAGLQHPNIVTVHDFGVEDGRPYLVQDLLEGEDLDVLIREGRTGDPETRHSWLRQIAQGLRFAHEHDVVHRDVKPANVRVSPDGRVRILDFGIAKVLTAEEELTRTGMSLGTAGYVSPEQLRDLEVDQRADVFSFGVLAYELVSGERPFSGSSISELFYQISHEDPPPVREVAPDCDPALAACVDRCLEKDREDRYRDFDEVLDALDEVGTAVGGDSGAGAGPGRRTAVAAAAVLVALAGVFGATRLLDDAGPPAAADPSVGDGARRAAAAGPDSGEARDRALATAAAGEDPAPPDAATGPATETDGAAADDPTGAGEDGPAGADGGTPRRGGVAAEGGDRQAAASGGGAPAGEGAAAAPTDGGADAPAPVSGVLVVVRGGDAPGRATAENVLLRELSGAGFEVSDRTSLELEAAAADGEPGSLGRRAGTAVVVLARYRASAAPGVGASYTGSATLSVRSYDTRTGELLASESFRVGGGGTPGEAGSTPAGAASRAAEKVGHQAAFALRGLLRDHLGDGEG